MRFMVMVLATKEADEAARLPTAEEFAEIIQVRSKAEAIEWASRAPFAEGTQLEIRQVFEDDDFAPSDPTGELREQDAKRRQEYARKA
jgi:hypothetical protein